MLLATSLALEVRSLADKRAWADLEKALLHAVLMEKVSSTSIAVNKYPVL